MEPKFKVGDKVIDAHNAERTVTGVAIRYKLDPLHDGHVPTFHWSEEDLTAVPQPIGLYDALSIYYDAPIQEGDAMEDDMKRLLTEIKKRGLA